MPSSHSPQVARDATPPGAARLPHDSRSEADPLANVRKRLLAYLIETHRQRGRLEQRGLDLGEQIPGRPDPVQGAEA